MKGRKINKKLFELDRTHNKYSNDNMIRKIKIKDRSVNNLLCVGRIDLNKS